MGRRGAYSLLGVAALILLILLWVFLPMSGDQTAAMIERRAGSDLVMACNEAAASSHARMRFLAMDVRRTGAEPGTGVAALASALEARRAGLVCRWNGVDPPTISRAESQ